MAETSRCSTGSAIGGNPFLQEERSWASSRRSCARTMVSSFDYFELKLLEDSRSSRSDAGLPSFDGSITGHDGEDDHQVGDGFVHASFEGNMARDEWGVVPIVKSDNWTGACIGPEFGEHDE